MTRVVLRFVPWAAAAALLFAGAAGAEGVQPAPGVPATRIALADPPSETRGGPALVFHNDAAGAARLLFARGAAEALDCAIDGGSATRSRTGQYLLSAGAELRCTAPPGRYRFETLTPRGGAIERARGSVEVR